MRKFGLIGYPLGHSFSQGYFKRKFEAENITDCSYENYQLPVIDEFASLISNNPDLCGLNVTIPYKTQILKYVNFRSPEVDDIGAANVLKLIRSGKKTEIYAYNSDITGIEDTLKPYIREKVKNAIILGTGGSSLAVTYVLKKLNINVLHISRNKKAGVLSYDELKKEMISGSRLIVNTTPLGMFPDIASKPEIDYDAIGKDHILFDLVYNPELTAFLKTGQERGCKIVGGLKMLYSQAERSWEIWNDINL